MKQINKKKVCTHEDYAHVKESKVLRQNSNKPCNCRDLPGKA